MKRFAIRFLSLIAAYLPLMAISPGIAVELASESSYLKVGVVDGSQPCSFKESGVWEGIAVELWSELAQREAIPFVFISQPTTKKLLEETKNGSVDIGVGCINITPSRYKQYSFSVPFQDDGIGVLLTKQKSALLPLVRSAVFNPAWIRLLLITVGSVSLLSLLVWFIESHHKHTAKTPAEISHRFVKIFTILITGEGDADIVDSIPGRGVILLAWVVRAVVGAAIVTVLTVNVLEDLRSDLIVRVNSLSDLSGLNIGYREGSASSDLLADESFKSRTIVPSITAAVPLLESGKIDAFVADQMQLEYLMALLKKNNITSSIMLSNALPEFQAFTFAPSLPESARRQINSGLIDFKRNQRITQIKDSVLHSASQ